MSELEKTELKQYAKGHKDARTATLEFLKENRGTTITDKLIERYKDEI